MCGIIAVLRRPAQQAPPQTSEVLQRLGAIADRLHQPPEAVLGDLFQLVEQAESLNLTLRGVPGLSSISENLPSLTQLAEKAEAGRATFQEWLNVPPLNSPSVQPPAPTPSSETAKLATRLDDAIWSIRHDRLAAAKKALELLSPILTLVDSGQKQQSQKNSSPTGSPSTDSPPTGSPSTDSPRIDSPPTSTILLGAALSIQTALSALDKLEVRGRDSCGLAIILPEISDSDLLAELTVAQQENNSLDNILVAARPPAASQPPPASPANSTSPAVSSPSQLLPEPNLTTANICFLYKTAAEIGDLGDNTAEIRSQILDDTWLHRCLAVARKDLVVLGHTRWASVGGISETNAHPLVARPQQSDSPTSIVVVNGDIDNYQQLLQSHNLQLSDGVTTDSQVVPMLIAEFGAVQDGAVQDNAARGPGARSTANGLDDTGAAPMSGAAEPASGPGATGPTNAATAFQSAVSQFQGSAAVVACLLDDPDTLHLSVHGSGQSLYVGLADDSFVVASEPYGLLEQTSLYLQVEGSLHLNAAQIPSSQTPSLGLPSSALLSSAGSSSALPSSKITTAEITTRDVNRGSYKHYFLKEISESPVSVRKTLESWSLPPDLARHLQSSRFSKIVAIGQGTAAIAARSFADSCQQTLANLSAPTPQVVSMVASELSGFAMHNDMSDHLVIAISQSGTTTDTNRTASLAQSRGAYVLAIVNRRNSDLATSADSVFYTSDGRDVEMSVASTKAFYSQVVAGLILAHSFADCLQQNSNQKNSSQKNNSTDDPPAAAPASLSRLPATLTQLLKLHPQIRNIAREVSTSRRDWAVVGSGRDRLAAEEVRIKLSELCYKSVACDSIEDKKHIDLSAEPLVLVCAAGISGSNMGDIAKEVDIYVAHKACPVVFAPEGVELDIPGSHIIEVPIASPELGFVSSAMAGHLFAYEAALAIDALADPLRATKTLLTEAVSQLADIQVAEQVEQIWESLQSPIRLQATRFFADLTQHRYDGHLSASLAARLSSLFRYVTGEVSLRNYQQEFNKVGTPEVAWQDLLSALTQGTDTLSRPVDAIRHQAKTVTVGITRSDEVLLSSRLASAIISAGVSRNALTYETLRMLDSLSPVVREITGHTRYEISGEKLSIVGRSGVSLEISSAAESEPELLGTKHMVAAEQQVFLTVGRRDWRSILIVPEIQNSQTTGLTLLHVELQDFLSVDVAVAALRAYRGRFEALWGAVTETEKKFDMAKLAEVPALELFTEPIVTLADRWRGGGERGDLNAPGDQNVPNASGDPTHSTHSS